MRISKFATTAFLLLLLTLWFGREPWKCFWGEIVNLIKTLFFFKQKSENYFIVLSSSKKKLH